MNLDDLFDGLPEQIVEDLFPEALSAGASVIQDELRSRTPESEDSTSSREYGHMRDDIAITIRVSPDSLEGSARIGFGVTGYKARLQEYGFTDTSHKGKRGRFIPGRGFIRASAEAAGDRATDAFVESLGEDQ